MNFNYDLATWIDYFIGAFICCLGGLLIGKILLKKNFKDIKKIRLLLLIPLTIFTILNTLAFNNILKLFGVLVLDIVIYQLILEEKGIKVLLYPPITIMILSLAEIVFVLFISLFDYIFNYSFAILVTNSLLSNTIISLLSIFIARLLGPKMVSYVEKIDKSSILIIMIPFLLTIFLAISSINFLYIEKWKFSYKLILIVIIMFGLVIMTFSLLIQYLKNKEVVTKHKMLEEYLKTSADLIEKYSSTVHRYKNNLIVIKGYLKSSIPEANKYIDSLLDKIEDKKYTWVKQINNISIDSIRYLIYYKLSKAEESNLKIFVNVSNEVKNIKNNFLTSNELGRLLDILGEYFDNAIYASNESKEKELNIDIYKSNNKLIFSISNTYKGTIDFNLINKNGYSTKGKGHGFGLYDIEKTIKNINILSSKYKIIDNYFAVTLKVEINKKN